MLTRAKYSKMAMHCTSTASETRYSLKLSCYMGYGISDRLLGQSLSTLLGTKARVLSSSDHSARAAKRRCGRDLQVSDALSELMDVNLLWWW